METYFNSDKLAQMSPLLYSFSHSEIFMENIQQMEVPLHWLQIL